MKHLKTLITLTILLISTLYVTLFTIKTYDITQHIYEDPRSGKVYWRTSSPGTIFPWPTRPGPLEALSPMNHIDTLIYKYLIKTQMLTLITAAMYITLIYYIIKRIKKHSPSTIPTTHRLQ